MFPKKGSSACTISATGRSGSRKTLEAFYRWCYEQGVTSRHLRPEDVYAPETLTEFKI